MKKETALVIPEGQKAELAVYSGPLFTELDFSDLEQVIDKIAESSDELTDGMRAAAADYAEQWKKLVVERLNVKKKKLEYLLEFFKHRNPEINDIRNYNRDRPFYISGYDARTMDAIIPHIVSILKADQKLEDYADRLTEIYTDLETLDEDREAREPKRDDYLFDEENMTYNERVVAVRQFEYDLAKYQQEYRKESFKIRKTFAEVHTEITKEKVIKDLIKSIEYQIKKSQSAYALAKEKASLVTLSIQFGTKGIIEALRELHDFQKNL